MEKNIVPADFQHVRFERRGFVATITLNRPERRNALNYRAYDELEAALRLSSSDTDVRCVIVTGADPAGFAMGMPFPTALARLEQFHKPALRWAWSLNAASSVLGSVGALVCAVYLGLMQTLLVGGALYLCALAIFALSARALAVAPTKPGLKLLREENVRS